MLSPHRQHEPNQLKIIPGTTASAWLWHVINFLFFFFLLLLLFSPSSSCTNFSFYILWFSFSFSLYCLSIFSLRFVVLKNLFRVQWLFFSVICVEHILFGFQAGPIYRPRPSWRWRQRRRQRQWSRQQPAMSWVTAETIWKWIHFQLE